MDPVKAQATDQNLTVRFEAKVQRGAEGSNGATLVVNPSSAAPSVLNSAKAMMVEGVIEGLPIRAQIMLDSEGCLRITLSERQANALNLVSGSHVVIEVARIGDTPELRIPLDLAIALDSQPSAASRFAAVTPMARREWVRWIISPKQAQTRAHRIQTCLDMLENGKKRPCCFPGINWVTKDLIEAHETWIGLPSSKGD